MRVKFKGRIVLIDKDDLHILFDFPWHIHVLRNTSYLRTSAAFDRMYLHNLIVNASEVDHKNRNGLDNRKCNLRIANRSLNNANRKDLGSKGVHFEAYTNRYRALIHFKGKKYSLGRFKDFKKAKAAYNKKARVLFGEFARYEEA